MNNEFDIDSLDAVISEAESSLVQLLALQLKRELLDSEKFRNLLEESQREFRSADITMQNLEAKCVALAAENAGLKEACGGDGSYRDCPACAHSEYIEAPDTPATSAFLAEVRAQGVEMFAAGLKVAGGHEHTYSAIASEFAAQLRKGVQS